MTEPINIRLAVCQLAPYLGGCYVGSIGYNVAFNDSSIVIVNSDWPGHFYNEENILAKRYATKSKGYWLFKELFDTDPLGPFATWEDLLAALPLLLEQ